MAMVMNAYDNDPDDNTAVNRIIDGHCPACDKDVDPSIQGIKCWFCCNYFHAINCADEK